MISDYAERLKALKSRHDFTEKDKIRVQHVIGREKEQEESTPSS